MTDYNLQKESQIYKGNDVPIFSVVIPLYNKRPYIRRAVDSVLSQVDTYFELIVVDDGSTDGSCEELANIEDERLRIICQVNGGEGAARNTGMRNSTAAWIAFLDADDAWMPDHLSELRKVSLKFSNSGLISTRSVESNRSELPVCIQNDSFPSIRKVDYFVEASKKIGFINASSVAVKKEVFEKIEGFTSVSAGADLEYWARIALHYSVAVSDKVTCVYFRNTGGVMQQLSLTKRPRRALVSLRELSSSVAMLCDRAEEDPNIWKNPSIRAYINGRLASGVWGALYHGDIPNARNIASFMVHPLAIKQYLYRIVLALPAVLLSILVRCYKNVKLVPRRLT